MNLYLVFAIDESQHVVAWDGVTAVLELKLIDVVVSDIDRLLAIEILWNNKVLWLFLISLLLFAAVEEGHILTPSALVGMVLAQQFVDILVAQQDGLLSKRLEELLAVATVVKLSELVGSIGDVVDVVLLQEFAKDVLALLLQLTTITAQDGLYLTFGLGSRYKVNP